MGMSAEVHIVRLVPSDGSDRTRAHCTTPRLLPMSVALVIAAILVAVVWSPPSERKALRALPDEQRTALLARTVDELRLFCGEGRPAVLQDHCRELASFAAQFDGCRGDCEALVRHQLTPVPTR